MKSPKYEEDPEEKAARERERRLSEIERTSATEKAAAGLTSDLRATYGLQTGEGFLGTALKTKKRGPKLPTFEELFASFSPNEPDKANLGHFAHAGYTPGVDYRFSKASKK